MLLSFAQNWWTLGLRGLVAIIFGIATLIFPEISFLIFLMMLALYFTLDGIFTVILTSNRGVNDRTKIPVVIEGVFEILLGIAIFGWPEISAFGFTFLLAFWAIITGILKIIAAIRLRKIIANEWILIFSGVLSLLFGLGVGVFPMLGILITAWMIGIYALIFGTSLLMLAIKLRRYRFDYFEGPSIPRIA